MDDVVALLIASDELQAAERKANAAWMQALQAYGLDSPETTAAEKALDAAHEASEAMIQQVEQLYGAASAAV